MTLSYDPELPTSDTPNKSVFESLIKNDYHVKFYASSSKIGQVMAIVVHAPL